jgi:mannose-1-phosphate guanylyltransferase
MNKNHYCVIMAGGIGSRFWPVSRNSRPKQFLDILGVGKSFLQQTFERFARMIPQENILIVTSCNYADLVREQLPGLDPWQLIAEPSRCNTAPCIAYANYKIIDRNPNAAIVVAPSDHLILNEAEFLQVISHSLNFASTNNVLVTIGIKPSRPETGYGYIQMSLPKERKIVDHDKPYKVKTFTEKPSVELAKVFVESGEFFWNSGIFIWTAKAIQQSLQQLLPEVDTLFKGGIGKYNTVEEERFIKQVYSVCRSVSIDYGIMEKADNVYAFPGEFGWSDLGTWESLYLQWAKDERQTMVDAQHAIVNNVSDCEIAVSNKDKLIVVEGLRGYLVADTDDVLLICPRNNEERLKQIMKEVDEKYL